jgi:hypothetical protein
MPAAIRRAARRQRCPISQYVRGAIRERLERDGVCLDDSDAKVSA